MERLVRNIHRRQGRLSSLIVVILTLLAVTTVVNGVAQAQATWPVAVTKTPLGGLVTTTQGAVAVSGCSTWGQYAHQFETYTSDGTLAHSIPNSPQNYGFCSGSVWSVGSNGTQYMQCRAASGNPWQVRAIKGSTILWTSALPHSCGAKPSELMSLSVGKNNVVYVLSREDTCTSKTVHLIYLNGSTGAILRDVFVGTPGSFCCFTVSGLAPYNNGVAVWTNNSLYYYNSAGAMVKSHYAPAEGPKVANNHTGRVHLSTIAKNNRCQGGVQSAQVKGYDPVSSVVKVYTFSTPCVRVLEVLSMPDGGALVRVRFDSATVKLLRLDTNLAYKWLLPLPAEAGSTRDGTDLVHMSVDTSGNILTFQNVVGKNNHYGVLAHLLDGKAGVVRAAYSSLAMDSSSRLKLMTPYAIALSTGKLYVGLRKCKYDVYDLCWSSNGDYLYQISFAEMGMDYPRGTLLGAPNPPPAKVYAALGDSFSAGEGNPAFEAGTDTAGPPENRCHRSKTAYPYLLANDPSLTLNSPLFVACSGAVTRNVTDGQWNEGAQLEALGRYTNVVTISIGGNDARFRELATACVMSTCEIDSSAYRDSDRLIETELQSRLAGVYRAILTRAPNAQVYVVGYPFVTPPRGTEAAPYVCGWLTENESEAARLIVLGIKQKTLSAIKEVNSSRLHYIDLTLPSSPFIGRELCNGSSYAKGGPLFNDVNVINQGYSFHPNKLGLQAYAKLVRKVMLGDS